MEIPQFPASRPLDINDKRALDPVFDQLQPRISELTFAGLFLFRKAHDYRLTLVKDALVVLGKGYDGGEYFLPPLNGDVATALDLLFKEGMELYGADEQFAERYLSRDGIRLTEDRDAFDYLYLKDELATLPGNRYHKKKNRLNYFTARNRHEIQILSCARCSPPHRSSLVNAKCCGMAPTISVVRCRRVPTRRKASSSPPDRR
jgi:hypothetical protein